MWDGERTRDDVRRIVETQRDFWGALPYDLDALHADTGSGHNVVKTVFVECRSSYRTDGPEHLRPIGETEYVAANAAESARRESQATIAGIVAHADLDSPHLDETL